MRLSNVIESSKEFICGNKNLRTGVICRNLVVLTLVGILLRVFVTEVVVGGLDMEYYGDEPGYIRLATEMFQGRGFIDQEGNLSSYRTPGLPFLLAILISITGPNVVVIRIFMCVVGSLLIPACYLLGRSMLNSRAAGWMAIIAVISPLWVYSSGWILSDLTGGILTTMMAWMLIEGHRRQSLLWIGGAGVLCGIASLVRAASFAFVPGIILWLLLMMPDWKRRLTAVAVVLVSLTCILMPWSIRNTRLQGTFVLLSTMSGTELYKGNNPEATGILTYDFPNFVDNLSNRYSEEDYPNEVIRGKLYKADAIKYIRENPRRFAELCMIRFIQFWKIYSPRAPVIQNLAMIIGFGVALPFFLIQVIRRGWRRGPELLLLLIIASQTAAHMLLNAIVRYRMALEPLILVMAIAGFFWVLDRLPKRKTTIEE